MKGISVLCHCRWIRHRPEALPPLRAKAVALLLSAAMAVVCRGAEITVRQQKVLASAKPAHSVTNVAQFRSLSSEDYLDGCAFHLTGVLTLVDSNRDLVVLQDATGAVGLRYHNPSPKLQVGLLVTLEADDCCPSFASFPDYPYQPSGREIRDSFEAPRNWGTYYLTCMRGYLHPPATGHYSFWIASDNSSELWLSLGAEPSKARRIAFIPRYAWVGEREWSRFPSQTSAPVLLQGGETYYIEALQEQTTGGDHLAVAWQGPGLDQSVIDARYLTPYRQGGNQRETATNGILREFWTNYSAGDLTGLSGARPFKAALSARHVHASIHGPGPLPNPDRISLTQQWPIEQNYRWVQAEGMVKFAGAEGNAALLELSDGQGQAQVRALHWAPEITKRISQSPVRIQGVCEAVYDQNGALVPGLIWASGENSISFIESATTNMSELAIDQPALASMAKTKPGMQGFYGTRGVVTFNDRALDNDYIFVQEDTAPVLVAIGDRPFKNQLRVGQWVELGGTLQPGNYLPVISPLVLKELGWHCMPTPVTDRFASPASREGRWSELEGVVHSANSNGTISVMGKNGPVYFWVGQTPSNCLVRYVDAKLRARGVLLSRALNAPLLLIPSRTFVDVEEEPPADPFEIPRRSIANVIPESMEASWPHRARVAGEVTYRAAQSFFIQDSSGGIRVRASDNPAVEVGQAVEVVGFPTLNDSVRTLTEALVRPAKELERVKPKGLDLSEALSSKQSGTLVQVSATLLGRKTNEFGQMLELQEQQRVFAATLGAEEGSLAEIAPGSRLQVTGVWNNEPATGPVPGDKLAKGQLLASLNLLLRSPADVVVLRSPPWWTTRRTVTMLSTLLLILVVTLLWVHLLRRRLERQQAAQLAFSRQVLERLEEERRRIAVNLHDSLGQILLAIKNQALLAMQRSPDDQGWRQRLDEISGASSQAIEEVRQITHGLRPYQLDRLGLAQAIRASIERASSSGAILFASRVENIDGLFGKDADIHIYRIVQEAVTNVVKHSGATEATVVIKNRPAVVSLSIRDNGRGFDPAQPASQAHGLGCGLSGIAERVRILGGTLLIDSRPGAGTSLTMEIPLPTSKHEPGSNSPDRG
jgi:signal transduction histidine kinase